MDLFGCSAQGESLCCDPQDDLEPVRIGRDEIAVESNAMQYEEDGRYNRVFDLAEEGLEGSYHNRQQKILPRD
jgi:hypothetical protein